MSSAVWNAAEAAVTTLRNAGYPNVCFIGGVACNLYGNARTPKDLDILILNTSDDQESIKRRIVLFNQSFYLVASKKEFATYKVLWYRSGYTSIKVDILLPGIMDIPYFPTSRIDASNLRRLPTAPLAVVLLLKLQAWSQHRAALEWYFSKEQHKDKADLESLVPVATRLNLKVRAVNTGLPATFISSAGARVLEYLTAHPTCRTRDGWKSMGFSVPALPPSLIPEDSGVSSNLSGSGVGATTSRYRVKPLPRTRALYSFGSSRY